MVKFYSKVSRYLKQAKPERGVLFAYMQRLSGYSRQHLSRLIAAFRKHGQIHPKSRANRTSFHRQFTSEDRILLAEMDNLHDGLSGPATKVLLHRAYTVFGDKRFQRLSRISVSPLQPAQNKPVPPTAGDLPGNPALCRSHRYPQSPGTSGSPGLHPY